jgi:hypothetical protein
MTSMKWWIALGIGVLVLFVVGAVLLLQHSGPQVISSATSPDGSWSVAVLARPHLLSGSYDISVQVRDAIDTPTTGGFVIDLTSLETARKRHVVRFLDDQTAKVGDRVVTKQAHFKQ